MMKERSFPLLHSTQWLGSGSGQGKRSPESLTHILLGNQTIVILIQRIKNGVAAEPLISGNAAVTVHVVEHEDLLNGMAKGFAALQFGEAMGELVLERLDCLAEAFDAFAEFVRRHSINLHHRVETLAIHVNLLFGAHRMGSVEFAIQDSVALAKLIQQFGRDGEQIASGKFRDLIEIAETGPHYLSVVAVGFEIVENKTTIGFALDFNEKVSC